MTLRKIARLGHPALLAPAVPVADPSDPTVRALVGDMLETMAEAEGIGLAAPQVHAGLRVIVALALTSRATAHQAATVTLINPVLEPLGHEEEFGFEGCLSIPDLRGLVPRHRRVGFSGLDVAGRRIEGEAEGLFARVLQHEVDHLDGVLYPMRMRDLRHLTFTSELRHAAAWPVQDGSGV